MYKSSRERTEDYLENFDNDSFLKKIIGTDKPVCIDVGANVGQTVHKLKSVWKDAEVHSIEPLTSQYFELTRVAKMYDNVHTYNLALSKNSGMRKFHVNEHQIMLSGFYKLNEESKDSIALNSPEPAHVNFLKSRQTYVDTQTLDNWANDNNITHIDLLKMDTQGSEPEILEGGKYILNNTNVIVTELMFYDLYKKQNSFYDLEKTLLPLGFELYDIGYISKNPMTGRTDWVDVVYVKKDRTIA